MRFKEVIGHDHIKKHLINMVNEKRVSHAQMFAGPVGIGKLNMAIAFAQYLNCQNRQEDDSCGVCPSCVKYEKLIHPDLHFVFPVVKSAKHKDPVSDSYIDEWRRIILEKNYFDLPQWYTFLDSEKQGLIYSQESQSIIRKLSLKTFEAKYKVMIIWLPEKMHVAASNKLLKMLEEPPEGTVFILVSDNPSDVLGTIQSRTQLLKLPGIHPEDIANALANEFSIGAVEAAQYAKLARGNYVAARELLDQSDERKFFFDKFVSLMRQAYARKLFDLVDWCDEMYRLPKERLKNFLDFSLRLIRENFIMNINEDELLYLTPEERNFSTRFSPFINDNNVLQLSEEISLAHSHLEQNGNARIILMDLCLKIIMLLKQ